MEAMEYVWQTEAKTQGQGTLHCIVVVSRGGSCYEGKGERGMAHQGLV